MVYGQKHFLFFPYNDRRSYLGKGEGRAGVMWELEGKGRVQTLQKVGEEAAHREDLWTLLGS